MDGENLFIGPQLPKNTSEGGTKDTSDESVCTIGPKLPPRMYADQSVSSNTNSEAETSSMTETVDDDMYGPALPPHLKKNILKSTYRPDSVVVDKPEEDDVSSEEESYVIGPVPEGSVQKLSHNHQQLEIRANYLKRKMAEKDSDNDRTSKRETWMLELPPEKARNLGLGPRSFRMREAPDMTDRSDWTDTPADRERKQLLGQDGDDKRDFKKEMAVAAIGERDKAMESMVNKCKKDDDRQMSLLEMHQKKLKKKEKKKKKEKEKPERRPFDRNIDLQANRFDDAQKKSIFKKAQLLDTRFSQGESKYL